MLPWEQSSHSALKKEQELGREKISNMYTNQGFSGGSDNKDSACKAGELGFDPWIRKIPWRRKWLPTPVFLPGESCGQRSLAGYSSWGGKS